MFYQIKAMIQKHRIQFEKNISKKLRYNTPSESSSQRIRQQRIIINIYALIEHTTPNR
jgi:hypothetical protein